MSVFSTRTWKTKGLRYKIQNCDLIAFNGNEGNFILSMYLGLTFWIISEAEIVTNFSFCPPESIRSYSNTNLLVAIKLTIFWISEFPKCKCKYSSQIWKMLLFVWKCQEKIQNIFLHNKLSQHFLCSYFYSDCFYTI